MELIAHDQGDKHSSGQNEAVKWDVLVPSPARHLDIERVYQDVGG